jgi:hypothetical protein
LRWIAARRFRVWLNGQITSRPGVRVDIVAHSFGTYLVSKALHALPPGRSIHTLIFAGSVLKESFPLALYVTPGGAVTRFVNDCGTKDSVLLLSQLIALFMGKAGRDGFHGGVDSARFVNRFFEFGHAGYFEGDFVQRWWVPLIATSDPITVPADPRRPLGAWGGAATFLVNNAEPVKIFTAIVVAILVIYMPVSNHRQKVAFDKVRRYAYLNRLGNAAQMPLRDPNHVEELLRRDLYGLPASITIQVESHRDGSGRALPTSRPDELEQAWWNHLPLLFDWEKQAFKAMDLHAQANAELAVRNTKQVPDRNKARLLYEDAIREYQPVKSAARGSYALCLLDYARLLSDLGLTRKAIANFETIRKNVFPEKDNQARSPLHGIWSALGLQNAENDAHADGCPRSLQVDALCGEAAALRTNKEWEAAAGRLNEALAVAVFPERSPLLLAQIYNEQAWTELDRLNLDAADNAFSQRLEECGRPEVRDSFVAQRLRYHLMHGQAVAHRYRGKPVEALEKFDHIVEQLHGKLSEEYVLTPEQRRDLRDRMVNSMERRGDCELFRFGLPDADNSTNQFDSEVAWKAFALYEAAYRWTPTDDEDTRLLLLNRMYLARFLADPMVPDQEAASILIECERAYEKLNVERRAQHELDYMTVQYCARFQFAGVDNRPVASESSERLAYRVPTGGGQGTTADTDPSANLSMVHDDHDRIPRYRPAQFSSPGLALRKQAIESLRRHILQNGSRVEQVNRDRIEMLMLGARILLDERIIAALSVPRDSQDGSGGPRRPGPLMHDRVQPERDAAMLDDLVATLRGSQHPEMEGFIRPFHETTARFRFRMSPYATAPEELNRRSLLRPPLPPDTSALVPGAAPKPKNGKGVDEAVLFFWRVSPNLSVSAIRSGSDTAAVARRQLERLHSGGEPHRLIIVEIHSRPASGDSTPISSAVPPSANASASP